jgi:hypothetical protein
MRRGPAASRLSRSRLRGAALATQDDELRPGRSTWRLFAESTDQLRNVVLLPSRFVKRPAQALMPPFRLMEWPSGSESGLYPAAHRRARLQSLRVRLSALAGSAVHRMTAANGSSRSDVVRRVSHVVRFIVADQRPCSRRRRYSADEAGIVGTSSIRARSFT